MRALAIRHFEAGGLGILAELLVEHGYDVTVIDASAATVSESALEDWDLVIVLGSENAVYEDHAHVAPEIDLVRARLEQGLPTLGICFGAQLMAAALGGTVYRGASGRELGFVVVEPSEAGLASPLRHIVDVPVCEWHGDTFSLPPHVSSIASSERYGNQAFAIGETALAVQFHPEITREQFDRWVADDLGTLAAEGIDPDELRAAGDAHLDASTAAARRMFAAFFEGLRTRSNADQPPGSR